MRHDLPDEIARMLHSARRFKAIYYLECAAEHLMNNAPDSYHPSTWGWLSLYYSTRDEIAQIVQSFPRNK